MRRLGIDTGGTFTDFILFDGKSLHTLKILSTPDRPVEAIGQGLQRLLDSHSCEILHGSTVATNALLERKGARTALVTTLGFEDVLEIGRQNRPEIYSLQPSRPEPLVPSSRRFGVAERVLHDATVHRPLTAESLQPLIRKLRRARVESVAVCLLFSHVHPAHERKIERALRELKVPVSASHRILPEYREYERTSTTVVNAYLAPRMSSYLGELETRLRSGFRKGVRKLRIMQSGGGTVSVATARKEPVRTILSGPAAGVVGAWSMARRAGWERILTFDMGGTSTDVALCHGELRVTHESVVAGHPVGIPVIDIHTVGAGGGSLARLDAAGALRVGPESAGADPGPICYGKGERITVTDANLFLGKLDSRYPLGGSLELRDDRLPSAFDRLADRMKVTSPEAAAQGVLDVANANMEAALRLISVERGYDPGDFTLVTFGGAGGLHAVELAERLRIPRVLVPENPGLLSALGALLSDGRRDFSRTLMRAADQCRARELGSEFRLLEQRARQAMKEEGFAASRVRLERWIDMRYRGQSFELSFPFARNFSEQFHDRHEKRYGYSDPGRPSEIVTIRVRARGVAAPVPIPRGRRTSRSPASARIWTRKVRFRGGAQLTGVYERSRLRPGHVLKGPALVYEYSASTAIPPRYEARVDSYRNLIIRRH